MNDDEFRRPVAGSVPHSRLRGGQALTSSADGTGVKPTR